MVSTPLFTPERNECMNCLEPVKWPELCVACERIIMERQTNLFGNPQNTAVLWIPVKVFITEDGNMLEAYAHADNEIWERAANDDPVKIRITKWIHEPSDEVKFGYFGIDPQRGELHCYKSDCERM